MKNNVMLGLFAAVLLFAMAVGVYAHGGETSESDSSRWNMMGHMASIQEMDDMHKSKTEGIDPELKEQIDVMHDGCKSSFNRSEIGSKGMGSMGGSIMA